MARLTVEQIMAQIASTVNQESSAPTAGGAEFNLWLSFLNRAYSEWAKSNDWEELRKYYFPTVTGENQATVSLPQDFRKVAANVRFHTATDSTEGEEYPEIPVEERGLYDTEDKYVYHLGNQNIGNSFIFHPGTLSSGASIEIQYYSNPTSLASPAEVTAMDDPQYLVDRTIAYILEARSDPRFQEQETKAREKLMQMIEGANLAKFNSYSNPQYVKNAPLAKLGFRVGRD